MSASTNRLSLTMPGGGSHGDITPGEPVDIDVINDNMRKIDSAVGALSVSSTTRPSTPFVGQFVYETDTNSVSYWNGTAWVYINNPGHAEYNKLAQQVANSNLSNAFNQTRDAAMSINDTWCTVTVASGITALTPGEYIVAVSTLLSSNATGRSFVEFGVGGAGSTAVARSNISTADNTTVATSPIRVTSTATNGSLEFRVFQTTGGQIPVDIHIKITRLVGV